MTTHLQRSLATTGGLILLAALTGCRTIPHTARPPQRAAETIEVGGDVDQPQSIDASESVITLRKAFLRAGGFRANQPETAYAGTLVALRRADGLDAETWYVPLALVERDLAGDIRLRPGDDVQLVDWRHTTLATTGTEGGRRFVVRGLIERPGGFITRDDDLLRLSQIHSPAAAGAASRGNELRQQANLVIVTRAGPSGFGSEHFVVLLAGPLVDADEPLVDPGMRRAALADRDTIDYTRLQRVPLVLASLLKAAVDAAVPAEQRNRPANRHLPLPRWRLAPP